MERRNHARVAVNLKATLLDDQAMPVGCRVRDVSKSGMLLQHEHYDKATTFHKGDEVEVRLSIRQADERKLIPLSTTVRRVEENGIGVEFLQPQSQLMTLVEPYHLDKEDTQEMAANQARIKNAAASTASPLSASTSARASRRRHAIQRARAQFAETMKTADAQVTDNEQTGLASLITAVGILLLDIGVRTRLENRMSALESVVERQVNALTILRTRLTPADTHTTELSELNARVDTLATSFAALETRVMQDADQATATATASTADTSSSDPQPATNETAAEAPAKQTAQTQTQNFGDDGPWVINLVSLYDQAAAVRFTQKAHAQGIRADTRQVSVNGQQVWRIQVSGFSTRDEASAYSNESKAKLGLNNVWIFKKGQ
jgi:cell division septation protein DedD